MRIFVSTLLSIACGCGAPTSSAPDLSIDMTPPDSVAEPDPRPVQPDLAGVYVGPTRWTPIRTNIVGGMVTQVLVDPRVPATVYALAASGKLFRSLDRADSWNLVTTLPGAVSLAIDGRTSPSTLYAAGAGGVKK